MRPPEFTGGNPTRMADRPRLDADRNRRFNEAAGIHRRKRLEARLWTTRHRCDAGRFNEAAGIHRRKL